MRTRVGVRSVGGKAMQGVTKGAKTSGRSSRVWAMAVMILSKNEPVRFHAVCSSFWRVEGQCWDVLTVMMHFSLGIWE